MTCMEAQRLIEPYLNRKISDRDLEAFLNHVEHCPSCREELDISLKIRRVMEDVENDSGNNDYSNLLDQELKASHRHLRKARREAMLYRAAGAAVALSFAAIVAETVYQNSGQSNSTSLVDFVTHHRNRQSDAGVAQVQEKLSEALSEDSTLLLATTEVVDLSAQTQAVSRTVASTAVAEHSETMVDDDRDEAEQEEAQQGQTGGVNTFSAAAGSSSLSTTGTAAGT